MKKVLPAFLLLLGLLTASTSVIGQGTLGLGPTMNTYFSPYQNSTTHFGIWLRGGYRFDYDWRGVATLSFFFPGNLDDNTSLLIYGIDLDGHYIFADGEKWQAHVLAGINFLMARAKTDDPVLGTTRGNTARFGFNVGGGLSYKLTENLRLPLEFKMVFSSPVRINLNLGLAYEFPRKVGF